MARKPISVQASEHSDSMLDKLMHKVGELFAGLKATNKTVAGIGTRLEAVESDLAARPTFSPAAIKRASEKLDKLSLE